MDFTPQQPYNGYIGLFCTLKTENSFLTFTAAVVVAAQQQMRTFYYNFSKLFFFSRTPIYKTMYIITYEVPIELMLKPIFVFYSLTGERKFSHDITENIIIKEEQ